MTSFYLTFLRITSASLNYKTTRCFYFHEKPLLTSSKDPTSRSIISGSSPAPSTPSASPRSLTVLSPRRGSTTSSMEISLHVIVLKGLGFVEQRLYLYPKFFLDITVDQFFGDGVTPDHFYGDVLGTVLVTNMTQELWNIFRLLGKEYKKYYLWKKTCGMLVRQRDRASEHYGAVKN